MQMFEQVYASPAVQDMERGTLLAWRMSPKFRPTDPVADFIIEVSRSGVADDWETVADDVDSNCFVHTDRKFYAVDYRLYYRLSTEDARGTVTSAVIDVSRRYSPRDARLAAEIIRKETLALRYSGSPGVLYKRRHWGTPCTACIDHDLGTPSDARCPVCYGTGFVTGYHGISADEDVAHQFLRYVVSIEGSAPAEVRTENESGAIGTVDPQAVMARAVACPRVDSGDIWLDCATDKRYIVTTIEPVLFRGFTVAYKKMVLVLLQSSDICYRLPRPDAGKGCP